MAVKHAKVSAIPDGGNSNLVRPSDWNAEHTIEAGSIGTAELASSVYGEAADISDITTPESAGVSTKVARADHAHQQQVPARSDASNNRFRFLVSAARVYNNVAQSIANNSFVAVTFQAEDFDTDTIHDTAVNPSRLNCRLTGKYQIVATARWAINGTGERVISVRKNGVATDLIVSSVRGNGTSRDRHAAVGTLSLTATDYVEMYVLQDSGGALNLESSGQETSFEMTYAGE